MVRNCNKIANKVIDQTIYDFIIAQSFYVVNFWNSMDQNLIYAKEPDYYWLLDRLLITITKTRHICSSLYLRLPYNVQAFSWDYLSTKMENVEK